MPELFSLFLGSFNYFLDGCGFFLLCLCLFYGEGLALVSFDYRICHYACNQLDCPYCVVVAGNYVVDEVGVTVGIGDCNDGDVELSCLGNGDVLVVGVNYLHNAGHLVHVSDTLKVGL